MKRKNTESKVKQQISEAYPRLACNRQINIFDVTKLYSLAETLISEGVDVDTAVSKAIDVYCLPAR